MLLIKKRILCSFILLADCTTKQEDKTKWPKNKSHTWIKKTESFIWVTETIFLTDKTLNLCSSSHMCENHTAPQM